MTQQESNPALLPCPFCQGAATAKLIPETNGDWHHVDVTHIEGCFYKPKAERLLLNTKSLSAWNTRTAPAPAEPAASATLAGAANPAAPVVLPEPFVIATTKRESPTRRTVEFEWGPEALEDEGVHKLYTEQQVHTLLTSLAPPAPAAVAVTEAEKLLRAEAARPVSLYWGGRWYGFGAEKASHAKHLRVADALAATPAAKAEVQAEPVALQMCSELKPRSESEKAAYLAGVADGRMYAERDADTAPQAQPADALDAETPYQRGYRHGYNRRDAEVQGALL